MKPFSRELLSSKRILALLYLSVLLFRIWLCTQAPEDTSDLFRHLGFSSHLATHGLRIYETTAGAFKPEFWTRFWTYDPYIYPPGAMLFFSAFGMAGLGLFWPKLVFTLADLLSGIIFGRLAHPLAGALIFSAPVALWYTSHEGMYESLVVLPMIVAVYFADRRRWFAAGASWMLALQLKQFAIVLAPLLVVELARVAAGERAKAAKRASLGLSCALVPFLPFYLFTPGIWLRPLRTQQMVFNPFHWSISNAEWFKWMPAWLVIWSAIASGAIVVVGLVSVIRARDRLEMLERSPVLGFWVLLKSASWVQFWYVIPTPALALGWRHSRSLLYVLVIVYWLQCGRSLALLTGPAFGIREYQESIDHFHACRWLCDYRSPGAHPPRE